MMLRPWIAIVAIGTVLATPAIARGQSEETLVAELGSIDSMGVTVMGLDSLAVQSGFDERTVRTKAELALRQVGVRVVPSSRNTLVVSLRVARTTLDQVFYHWGISVWRWVYVFEGPTPTVGVRANVWDVTNMGFFGSRRTEAEAYQTLDQLIEMFQNAYLTANPRQ